MGKTKKTKGQRKIVLLIEDDREIVNVYTIAFEKADHFKVEPLFFGQDVLEWLEKVKQGKANIPDIILLDLILPDMNGLELLEKFKKEEKIKDIPVFILTNYTSSELKTMGYGLKSEEYLTKTHWGPLKLVKLVQNRLKESKKENK